MASSFILLWDRRSNQLSQPSIILGCFMTQITCGEAEPHRLIERFSTSSSPLIVSAASPTCNTYFYNSCIHFCYENWLRQREVEDPLQSTKPSFIGSQNNCSMLSRKRPASDTLLSLHPTKIHRTARRTSSGGRKAAGAEDTESIGARWIHIFREVWVLAGETFASIANGTCVHSCSLEHRTDGAVIGKNYTEEISFTLPNIPSSPLPLQSPSTPSPSYRSNLEVHTPVPIQFPKRRSPPGKLHQLTREPAESMLIEGPSRPSTVTVTTSTASIPSTSTLPSSGIDLNEVLNSSERRYKRESSPRKYQNRPHIYADLVCGSFLCYST